MSDDTAVFPYQSPPLGNSVKTRVREALSSYIYRRTKRSPMILPILMEV